jgi:8-oxo-dGTP pyrophosphatase MutT (NUDIX family)
MDDVRDDRRSKAVPAQPMREPGTRAARPRDAATLIIYREHRGAIEVLMGERHHKHKFLPQRYVFPGGRVDPEDSRVRAARPVRDDVMALLTRTATPARARALVAAAVRETFEEAGLMIGAPDPMPGRTVPANWRHFFATGMAPDLGDITYVARAVTPPWRPIRFNARFLMIDARHVQGDLGGGTGELINLTFVPVPETQKLELALITKRVLELVEDLARNPPPPGARNTVARFVHNGTQHDLIEE